MYEVIRADQANFDAREQMSEIFADGFTQWLGFFSKDRNKIARAFAHMFVLDQFYIAIDGHKVAAMAACTDGTSLSVKLDAKQLIRHLGLFKGSLAKLFLKKEFEVLFANPTGDQCSIEYVGTAVNYRGQGAASRVISDILENTSYKEYLIEEVADTNIPAMKLYEKLGFKEYRRKTLAKRVAQKIGINHFLSLKYVK